MSKLAEILFEIISQNTEASATGWLKEKAALNVNTAFAMVPRKTGKKTIAVTDTQQQKLADLRPGLNINGWSVDRLARVWLLMQLNADDKQAYTKTIQALFQGAEMNELVALYSALPVLEYPEYWRGRCAEGIRNNIGDVLQSVMCNNPYPAEQLDEAAWNQLVLKAFFTEKPIEQIEGLDRRANKALAETLIDYAHERWAAGRTVNPQLWRCVGPYIDESNFSDIKRIADSGLPFEREAAALACHSSHYQPAKDLIPSKPGLTWNILAEKIKDYVLQS